MTNMTHFGTFDRRLSLLEESWPQRSGASRVEPPKFPQSTANVGFCIEDSPIPNMPPRRRLATSNLATLRLPSGVASEVKFWIENETSGYVHKIRTPKRRTSDVEKSSNLRQKIKENV